MKKLILVLPNVKPLLFFLVFFHSYNTSFCGEPNLIALAKNGGAYGSGTIFRYTGGDTFVASHFNLPMGSDPYGSLIQASNGKMYGMTYGDSAYSSGTIFEYDYATNNFRVLQFFGTDHGIGGANPYGSLLQASDGKLYGVASNGGGVGAGALFSYDISYSLFTPLLSLPADGEPRGCLIQSSNGKLYGMTSVVGIYNGAGIFEYDIATDAYVIKYTTDSCYTDGSLLEVGTDSLYGLLGFLNADPGGMLLRYMPTIDKIDTLFKFPRNENPTGSLIRATNGKLYGLVNDTQIGGHLFSYDIPSGTCIDIYDCIDSIKGIYPYGSLFQASDGMIYGMMSNGGRYNGGTVFQFDINNSMYIKEVDLNDSTGEKPQYGNFIEYLSWLGTGINNAGLCNIKIYPSPADKILTIDMSQNTNPISSNYAAINLYNSLGQRVRSIPHQGNNKVIEIPVADLPDDIYISTIIDQKGQEDVLGKFIVER